jgi:hypothetical protein
MFGQQEIRFLYSKNNHNAYGKSQSHTLIFLASPRRCEYFDFNFYRERKTIERSKPEKQPDPYVEGERRL